MRSGGMPRQVRLPSNTLRECGHPRSAAQCHLRTHAPQQTASLPGHCWDICRRVGEAGIAKDMPNKAIGQITELIVGSDRRRLASKDNWWETVPWPTPSIIKS